jgi:hypothetical protein
MSSRRKATLVVGGVGTVVVVVLLAFALRGALPFPIPAGTLVRTQASVPFTVTGVERLVGAWKADGPTYTIVRLSNASEFVDPQIVFHSGCSLTYNVTLQPGSYVLLLSNGGSAVGGGSTTNVTVTQTIELASVTSPGAAVSWWSGQAAPCPGGGM